MHLLRLTTTALRTGLKPSFSDNLTIAIQVIKTLIYYELLSNVIHDTLPMGQVHREQFCIRTKFLILCLIIIYLLMKTKSFSGFNNEYTIQFRTRHSISMNSFSIEFLLFSRSQQGFSFIYWIDNFDSIAIVFHSRYI